MDNYYYELKYVDGEHTVIHKFPADIDIPKLADYLKDFLKGCSWYEKQVDKLINGGE
jgi:hypothetical protein